MRLPTILLTAALAVSTLGAQPGPPLRGERGPKLDEIKSYLGLSEEQVQQFQTLRQSSHESVRTILAGAREKREQLRQELARESPSPGIVGDLTVQLKQVRQQIGEKRKEFGEQARNILNAEQKAKLAALEEASALIPAIRQAQGLQLLEGENPAGPDFEFGPGGPGPRPGDRGFGMRFRDRGPRF